GDARDVFVTANFLHFQDVDGVFLATQRKHQVLPAFGAGFQGTACVVHDSMASGCMGDGGLGKSTRTASFLSWFRRCRPLMSRISATLPSPMMVAADTPGTLR